ncbi:MAG: transposase family protein [Gammaproteobacteria bacterium]
MRVCRQEVTKSIDGRLVNGIEKDTEEFCGLDQSAFSNICFALLAFCQSSPCAITQRFAGSNKCPVRQGQITKKLLTTVGYRDRVSLFEGRYSWHSEPTHSIVGHVSILEDPRIERHKKHNLVDILVLAICGVLSGAEGWEAIEEYGQTKLEWLRKFIPLENGIPVHDTMARVLSRISAKGQQIL